MTHARHLVGRKVRTVSERLWRVIAPLAGIVLVLAAAPSRAELPLSLGAVGYVKEETRLSVGPLVDYLRAELRRPVRLVMYPGYSDVVVKLASGDLDLAVLPPIVHLNVHDTLPTRTLAYGVYPTGNFTYHSVLLARKDDGKVRELADLKGQKVAFVDPFSASGYVFPKLLLIRAGIDPKSVKDVMEGNHLDALRALDAGQVAAAATYDLLFTEVKDIGRKLEDYKVLATSEPIPSEAIVAGPKLDARIADQVQDLLLAFYEKRKAIRGLSERSLYTAFIPPDPSVLLHLRKAYHTIVPESAPAPVH